MTEFVIANMAPLMFASMVLFLLFGSVVLPVKAVLIAAAAGAALVALLGLIGRSRARA